MRMRSGMRQWLAVYLVVALIIIGGTPPVDAGFSASEVIRHSPEERAQDLQKIQSILENKMVRERLAQLGYTQEEIRLRLTQLNDGQIHQLALKVDELKVGGDGAEVVIAVLVIVILVIILVYLLGHRIVIKK